MISPCVIWVNWTIRMQTNPWHSATGGTKCVFKNLLFCSFVKAPNLEEINTIMLNQPSKTRLNHLVQTYYIDNSKGRCDNHSDVNGPTTDETVTNNPVESNIVSPKSQQGGGMT
jgi:hypothetical protein